MQCFNYSTNDKAHRKKSASEYHRPLTIPMCQ